MRFLEVSDLYAGYGRSEILHGVSMGVDKNETVTIIGPNGAGKSTVLKAIMGYISIFKGDVHWKNQAVTKLPPHRKVSLGIGYVPQLGNVFPSMSVRENLEMGAYIQSKRLMQERMEKAFGMFPILGERLRQKAGTLSGGQRQMLAMGRALMTDPELLLLDEPSAGLSPKASEEVFATIADIQQRTGSAIVIIEQDAYQSLSISNRGYVLVMGQNEFEDRADKILSNENIAKAYLGG
jgi:ABC-type branched-subunit amino acid transport system ATPase component